MGNEQPETNTGRDANGRFITGSKEASEAGKRGGKASRRPAVRITEPGEE